MTPEVTPQVTTEVNPVDRVFDAVHREIVGEPYVPRMNRRWQEVGGRIVAVSPTAELPAVHREFSRPPQ